MRSVKGNFTTSIERKYFEDDDATYIMSRLPNKFAFCSDNKADEEPEVIK
jgi:hypothetical protein